MKYDTGEDGKGVEVTSRRGNKSGPAEVVGRVNIEIFESIEEMTQFLGSSEKLLALANTQYATNVKNEIRRLANTSVSDTKLRTMAVDRVYADVNNLQMLAAAASPAEMAALKEKLVGEMIEVIKAEFEARKGSSVPASVEGTEDSEA
jgi:hypothetical protein